MPPKHTVLDTLDFVVLLSTLATPRLRHMFRVTPTRCAVPRCSAVRSLSRKHTMLAKRYLINMH